jgi:hypothetical protein
MKASVAFFVNTTEKENKISKNFVFNLAFETSTNTGLECTSVKLRLPVPISG